MTRLQINNNNFDNKIKSIEEKLRKKEITVPYGVGGLYDNKNPGKIKFWILNEVVRLGAGKSFGELALET